MKSIWINKDWNQIFIENLPEHFLSLQPKDIGEYHDEPIATKEFMQDFYLMLFSSLSYHESRHNPKCTYKEAFLDRNGKNVISMGLFQVSYESCLGWGFSLKKPEDLFNPVINIKAAIHIGSRLILKYKRISGKKGETWLGLSRYWSPFRKEEKIEAIAKNTRKV